VSGVKFLTQIGHKISSNCIVVNVVIVLSNGDSESNFWSIVLITVP